MKKMMMIAVLTLATVLAQAQQNSNDNFTTTERAELHTFKMMMDLTVESYAELLKQTAQREVDYNNLGFLSLGAKSAITQENCVDIQTSMSSSLLMLGTSLEQAKGSISKLDFQGQDQLVENYLKAFIQLSKQSIADCRQIGQSRKSVDEAYQNLAAAKSYFDIAIPALIQEK